MQCIPQGGRLQAGGGGAICPLIYQSVAMQQLKQLLQILLPFVALLGGSDVRKDILSFVILFFVICDLGLMTLGILKKGIIRETL